MSNFSFWLFLANPFIGIVSAPVSYLKSRSTKCSALFGSLFYGFISYFIEPSPDIDLGRYFEKLDMLREFSLRNFFSYYDTRSLLDLSNWYFFALSKLGNNHITPFITMAIVYYILFFIILDNAKRIDMSKKSILIQIVFILCIFPYPGVVSNTRNILAFSLFIMAFYRDVILKKRGFSTYALYLIGTLLHMSTALLILFRILIEFFYDGKRKTLFIVLCSALVGCSYVVLFFNFISNYLPNLGPVSFFLDKAYFYVTGFGNNDPYTVYLRGSLFMKLQRIFFISINFYFLYLLRLKHKMKDYDLTRIETFFLMICLLVIGTAPILLPVYWRFSLITIMLSGTVFTDTLWKRRFFVFFVMLGLACTGFVYQILLLGQYTDLGKFSINVLTNNFFSLLLGGYE